MSADVAMRGAGLDLVMRARRAVLDGAVRPCSAGLRAGRIAAIGPYDAALTAAEVTGLAADEVLLPGLVDTRVHVNEPGRKSAEGRCHVDVGFWAGAIPGNAAEFRRLHEQGSFGFECFLLPSAVDEFPPSDEAGLEVAMREIAAFDGPLIVDAEDAREIGEVPRGRGYAPLLRSRPPAAELRAIGTVLETAGRTGTRVQPAGGQPGGRLVERTAS